MSTISDVNERIPYFREALASIDSLRNMGALENVDQSILDYIDAAEPVGLTEERQIVIPQNLIFQEQPPVLIMQAAEAHSKISLATDDNAVKAARYVADKAGYELPISADPEPCVYTMPRAFGCVTHISLPVIPDDPNEKPFTLFLPRIMFVTADKPTVLGSTFTHEADHWDFSFNQTPELQARSKSRYSASRLMAAMEKRAYRLNYDTARKNGVEIEQQVGAVAARYVGLLSHEVDKVSEEIAKSDDFAFIKPVYRAVVMAIALEDRFGSPGELVTDDEATAFESAGLTYPIGDNFTPYDDDGIAI